MERTNSLVSPFSVSWDCNLTLRTMNDESWREKLTLFFLPLLLVWRLPKWTSFSCTFFIMYLLYSPNWFQSLPSGNEHNTNQHSCLSVFILTVNLPIKGNTPLEKHGRPYLFRFWSEASWRVLTVIHVSQCRCKCRRSPPTTKKGTLWGTGGLIKNLHLHERRKKGKGSKHNNILFM